MKRPGVLKYNTLFFLFAGLLAAAPALADKPSWGGDRRGEGRERHDRDRREHSGRDDREERRYEEGRRGHFNDENRRYIHDYYYERFYTGRCPPGLLKKHNGCMPPGQARKWMIGRPLPPGLIYYDLPPGVIIQLGYPPRGYRYVRVASDILLIAVGTGMVVDAIEDLGRM